MERKIRLTDWIAVTLVAAWAVVWMLPIWNVLATATKTTQQYVQEAPWSVRFSPETLVQLAENVVAGLTATSTGNALGPGILNSLLYGVVGASLAIAAAALAAYSLARLPVRGRFVWFMLIFSGTIFPFQIYLVPLFRLYQEANLYDTRLGMILFYTAICIPFCLLFLRNWFLTIPQEIFDAARLDGCGSLGTFLYIFVPLSWAPFATLFLFQFTWIWNDLVFGLVLTRSADARPVMPLLAGLQGLYSTVGLPVVLASALVASLPTIVLVLSFQRHFFRGLTVTTTG